MIPDGLLDDNYRGRGVYDRLAKRTMWITYDLALG